MAKQQKFTFKTEKPTGRYSSFFNDYHIIKFKKKSIGQITDKEWKIRLQVIKKDINENGNPNCKWKWITLKIEFKSLQEAKDFLNSNIEAIFSQFEINLED